MTCFDVLGAGYLSSSIGDKTVRTALLDYDTLEPLCKTCQMIVLDSNGKHREDKSEAEHQIHGHGGAGTRRAKRRKQNAPNAQQSKRSLALTRG